MASNFQAKQQQAKLAQDGLSPTGKMLSISIDEIESRRIANTAWLMLIYLLGSRDKCRRESSPYKIRNRHDHEAIPRFRPP